MTGPGILLVEDEAIIARDIERQLVGMGYRPVGIASTGAEAVAMAGRLRPELVLMDIHLSGAMDGIDAATTIRKQFALPSVFLTAYATDDVVERAKRAEPLGYIIKPFDEHSLRTAIEIALHKDRIDHALRKSEARYRALVESAHDAIVTADAAGRVVGWSPSAASLFGHAEAEVMGQPLTALFPARHHDKCLQGMRRAGSSDSAAAPGQFLQLDGQRKDGSEFPLELSLAHWQTAEGWFVTGMIRDVTEPRRLQEQFLQAQKMEVVGRLAGGIAHDFNNLLTVINGTADLAIIDLPAGHPLRSEFEHIQEAGNRAVLLTRQLLAFSRKQILAPVVLNLSELVKGMRHMLQRLIEEDIDLRIDAARRLDSVLVDHGQLEQALLNLVVNARDAMPTGGSLTIKTRNVVLDPAFVAEHPGTSPGRHVMLAVTDTGVGMTAEVRGRIFEPFFTTKEAGMGTGLGLATVWGIVKQSGGSILVESEPGRGTRFEIFLPTVAAAPVHHRGQEVRSPRGTETVLVVEDERNMREMTARMLRSAGYRVLVASNGNDALAMARGSKGPVHLLIADVVMPDMSGPDVAYRVAAVCPEMKVLFISGHPDEAMVRHGVATNTGHFLMKPYTVAELTRKVREVLDEAPAGG